MSPNITPSKTNKIYTSILNPDIKMFRITGLNKQGSLAKILDRISKYSFDFTNCESSFVQNNIRYFQLDIFIRENAKEIELNESVITNILEGLNVSVNELPTFELPSFPTKLEHLDIITIELQDAQEGINDDHPGKNDQAYLDRRNEIGEFCLDYKMLEPIPRVKYLPHEKELWRVLYKKLVPMIYEHSCEKFANNFRLLEKDGLFEPNEIPQLDEINKYLISKCNWRIKPVNGILSQRAYLNSLAFRTFCSTQYLRHHDQPYYTPEPDILHEYFGHISMFLDPDFCDMSQKLGKINITI
jgi:phenylalanine-4-hydroxylase